jgi:hypothetical protein|tara:strand:- start:5223 stop:6326 length:1104 start_codon:yes stop_codon:yes gene_type:complete
MAAYGTKIAEGFSQKLMLEFYDKNLADTIVNRDYEGEINAVGSKLNILNFDRVAEKTYDGSDLAVDDLTENNMALTIDQYKSFYWREKTLDRWLSYIKNPNPTVVTQAASERMKNVDSFLLGLYPDVGAGNRVGTDYTTGTVTVDVTTGLVTGSGTTFTSDMVGRGFKATGHTTWYRIKSFDSTTSITIEDDKDDATSAYTGGAIGAGATYTIEANTALTITAANLLEQIGQLKLKLDEAEANGHSTVPDSDRWLIIPPVVEDLIPRATGVALHVPAVYENLVQKGMVTMLQGFKVFRSNRLTGDNTDGYRVLAGHPAWVTFAEKMLEVGMEDLTGNFGKAYKDLFVYGAKVTDERRHFAAEGFWKV